MSGAQNFGPVRWGNEIMSASSEACVAANDSSFSFSLVVKEIRSLVARRRELMVILGTIYVAMGIYLENVLQGKLPHALKDLSGNAFLTYSLLILVPALLICLHISVIHSGMIQQGIYYAFMEQKCLNSGKGPRRASRLNLFGVSTQFFLLSNFIVSTSAAVFALALSKTFLVAASIGAISFGCLGALFLVSHWRAKRLALRTTKLHETQDVQVSLEQLTNHKWNSLDDCKLDIMTITGFVGLMLFSMLQSITGIGEITVTNTDIASANIQRFGPVVYGFLTLGTSVIGLIIFLRLTASLVTFALCLQLPHQASIFTQLKGIFLGYCLLTFFLAISVHLLIHPILQETSITLLIVNLVIICMALLFFPLTVFVAFLRGRSQPNPINSKNST